jgi:hypothetical protein
MGLDSEAIPDMDAQPQRLIRASGIHGSTLLFPTFPPITFATVDGEGRKWMMTPEPGSIDCPGCLLKIFL